VRRQITASGGASTRCGGELPQARAAIPASNMTSGKHRRSQDRFRRIAISVNMVFPVRRTVPTGE
jgi:hypothetical protein